ncbi:PAS domain S-box protein, partial [bacterium]|nr:PAS domain S-box protein [bacterium]
IYGEKFLAPIAIYPVKESFILKSLEKSKILIKEEEERFKDIEKDIEREKIIEEFNRFGYEVAVGILQRGNLIGAVLLKKKIDGTVFTFKEQILLENFGAQLGIAIENLKLYHQISEINSYIRSLLDNSPFGVVSFDKLGQITIFNKQMEKLMGRKEEEVRGKPFSEVLPPSVVPIVKKTLHRKVPITEEIFLNHEGRKYNIRLNVVPFWDEEKHFIGIQLIFTDITKIKKLEEEIRRADKLASLGVMAAGLAHEIKNPLVSIKAFAQLLPKRYQDEEFRNTFSDLLIREVDRINRLIEQVLAFSKLKIPKFEKVDIVKVMKSALILFSTQSKKKNLKIFENYYSDSIIIEGNEEKLQQAFLNILINAGEAIKDEGIIKINVSDEGENVRIEIEDNGCGIKREFLEKIFDPFFTTKEKGTGLGLSIVSRIIDEHKGKLRVESEEKIGTKVIIILRKRMKERTNELHYSSERG